MRNALKLGGMFAYGIFNNGDPTNAQSKPLSWYLPKATKVDYVFYGDVTFNQDIGAWFTPQNGDVMQVQNISALVGQISSGMLFNNGGSPNINNWRTPNATSMYALFLNCPSFNQPVGNWTVNNVTDMSQLFKGASSFNQDLSSWNTANATSLNGVFQNAIAFNNGDPGNNGSKPLPWNVSKVTNFQGTFIGASAFNQYIGNWDTSAATNFAYFFSGATLFNNGDITNVASKPMPWNTSNVTSFYAVFNAAQNFNQDISSWDVSKGLSFYYAFYSALAFNQNLGNWNPASATNFQHMFSGARAFNNGDSTDAASKPLAWSNTSNVTTMFGMFDGAVRFNQSVAAFDTSNVTTMANMFRYTYRFNQPLNAWNVSKVTTFSSFLEFARSFKQDLSAWTPTAATTFGFFGSGSEDINAPGTTDNYDNLLLRLANVTQLNSKSLYAGKSRYSYVGLGDAAGATGRAHLTAATNASPTPGHAWSIGDGGSANCTFSNSSGLLVTYSFDRPTYSRVVFKSNGSLPTGITAGTTYWTVRVSSTTARLATSLANAQANTVIPYTDAGTGTHAAMDLGHVFTASSSSGSLLLTLTTGGDLTFSGRKVRFATTGTLPTGITAGVDYRLNRVSTTTYRVMSDVVDAVDGTNPITFTDAGSGTHEIIFQ
jgi:surface protein